jgi:hypothetical protein
MASLVPSGEPTTQTLVGAQTNITPDSKFTNTTMEYNYSGKWLLINVATSEKGSKKTIVGFNVVPETQSLADQNRFRLGKKSVAHYSVLAAALGAVSVTLISLIACIRTKLRTRKWPWVLFILIGIGNLSINWTTGQITVMPVVFLLFSAAAAAPLYGPWTVSVGIPIGAILFLYRRKTLAQRVAGS